MGEYEWTCAGCGVPSPNKMRSCDCPTNVVLWDRKQAWKIDAGAPESKDAEIDRLRATEARLRAAGTSLVAAIDNMHERGETFTARVSIAVSDMRRALEQSPKAEDAGQ